MKEGNLKKAIGPSKGLRALRSKLRRFLLVRLKKGYIEDKLRLREGSCRRCGRCCMIGNRCRFLVFEGGVAKCRIYSHRLRQCRAFPIDERDLEDVGGECGFTFRSA